MSLISVASSGLMATQVAMNVVGENVANSTTDGYSRKTTTLTTTSDGGVTVSSINRVSSSYLNTQLWSANADTGYYTEYSEYLSSAEDTLSSSTMGISSLLDTFYTALSAASADPDDDSLRQTVLSDAESLAEGFNWISENLNAQYDSISSELDTSVSSVNDLSSTIANLNSEILATSQQGGDTSSLEDERDDAVSELSSLLDISVDEDSDGNYNITLAQGQPLVSGSTAATLSEDDGDVSLTYGTQTFSVSSGVGGSIGGLIDYQENVLDPTLDSLNDLASEIADDFNSLQTSGYDVNGDAGTALFTYDSANAAGTLSIADDFTTDDLAFSDSATDGSSNNGNLTSMLDLQDSETESYTNLVSDVAVKSSSASNQLTANTALVSTITSSISSNSGVSSDEEAANLLVYQNAYEANAKVITVASDLFDTLINMF